MIIPNNEALTLGPEYENLLPAKPGLSDVAQGYLSAISNILPNISEARLGFLSSIILMHAHVDLTERIVKETFKDLGSQGRYEEVFAGIETCNCDHGLLYRTFQMSLLEHWPEDVVLRLAELDPAILSDHSMKSVFWRKDESGAAVYSKEFVIKLVDMFPAGHETLEECQAAAIREGWTVAEAQVFGDSSNNGYLLTLLIDEKHELCELEALLNEGLISASGDLEISYAINQNWAAEEIITLAKIFEIEVTGYEFQKMIDAERFHPSEILQLAHVCPTQSNFDSLKTRIADWIESGEIQYSDVESLAAATISHERAIAEQRIKVIRDENSGFEEGVLAELISWQARVEPTSETISSAERLA